jgi:hypothetical protein
MLLKIAVIVHVSDSALVCLLQGYFVANGNLVRNLIHIAISGVCLLVVLAAVYFTESSMIQFISEKLLQKKTHSE